MDKFLPSGETKDMELVPTRCTNRTSRCCASAIEWWYQRNDSSSG